MNTKMIEVRVGRLARALGVHRNTVTNWIKSGKLAATATVGKKYRLEAERLQDFLERYNVPGTVVQQLMPEVSSGAAFADLPVSANPFEQREVVMSDQPIGSVLVVGGGIAGIQATLDLADSGYFVTMVEKSAGIGGVMAQLDKTYPTNDCAM